MIFQSTPLIRGETRRHKRWKDRQNFNPLPSYEGRLKAISRIQGATEFQSTPLIRGETEDVRAE